MFDHRPDPADIETEHLELEITTLAAQIYAATCRWLMLIAEFERRECHLSWGFHSTTRWLAWTCGLTARAAREHVRVGRDLRSLPRIREAFARGAISYSKVRALTRVAEPETEEELLELAQAATAAQLERTVRAFRSALAVASGEPPPDTFFAWAWEDDGTLSVRGRLAADDGELLLAAMRNGHRLAGGRGRAVGGPPQRNTDALVAMAEASLAPGGATRSGGDRNQVVLHIAEGGRRELDSGSTVDVETTRRILCDASMVGLVEGSDGEPLSVGRRTRTVPGAIRRALRARDGGCRFPGCSHDRFVDAHHIEHWADGGDTAVDNLVLLCRRHHRLIHEGGFALARASNGDLEFRDPFGLPLADRPPTLPYVGDEAIVRRSLSPPPLPSGDRLDLGLTVDCMLQRHQRAVSGARA